MTPFGWVLAGGAALAAAFAAGALAAERGLPRLIAYLRATEHDANHAEQQARELAAELADALEAIAEYKQAIPKVWDAAIAASRYAETIRERDGMAVIRAEWSEN